jgi:enoyl-CoA hydratase/carnithine racemase
MDLSPDNRVFQRMLPAIADGNERPARDLLYELKDCIAAISELPCPTFAAIEGACIGGGLEIALACDIRITARDAHISLTEVRAGMIPDLGGSVRLTRLIGSGRAADLIVTARRVSGEEAFALGFVERLVEPGNALLSAEQAAEMVVGNAPNAVQLALNVVRTSPDLGMDEALALETRAGVLALTSGEPQEGITAFLEKRKPDWKPAART